MRLVEVRQMAEDLVLEHLPNSDWVVNFDRGSGRAGRCDFERGRITLEVRSMLEYSEDEVLEVILHEIAHARVGPGKAHGVTWKKEARRLGASGQKLAPVRKTTTSPLTVFALWISVIVATTALSPVVTGVVAAAFVINYGHKIWRRVAPIDRVYKLK